MSIVGPGLGDDRRAARLLETRIVAVALISTITALVLTFSIYQWRNWSSDIEDLAADQLTAGATIAAVAHQAMAQDNANLAGEASALLQATEHATGAVYYSADGRRLDLRRGGSPLDGLSPNGALRAHSLPRADGVQVHVPHHVAGVRVGELVMRASHAALVRHRILNIAIAIGLSVVATIGSGLMARTLVRRALRPLRNLDAGIEAVAKSRDFTRTVEVTSDDEVGRLTRNFNGLLGALRDYDGSLHSALAEVTASRDAAEEANTLKSQFLANMSHEIRTPLNGVLGMAQVMALNDLSEGQRQRLETIQSSGTALLAILNDVLDLSKIEAGEMAIEAAPFDLEEVATGAFAVFGALAANKRLGFDLTISPEARGTWRGDSARLRQILYNLISNALKFTGEGEVAVRIEPRHDGEGLTITVADTGIGIGPEDLPRLFGSFIQGEAGATRRYGGAGLGLTICRGIIDLMGGTLEVESQPGVGSEFTVTLPFTRLEAGAGEVSAPDAPDELPPLRILVAEDNETNQLVIRTILGALGVEPVVVDNGRAAVNAWAAGGFDLVLMDIQMPEMDGVAATREIRRLEGERGLPRTSIFAVTANVMQHQVAEYLDAGIDGHVAKPVAMDKLLVALTSAPAGARAA